MKKDSYICTLTLSPNKFQITQTFKHKGKNKLLKYQKNPWENLLQSSGGKVRSNTVKFNCIKKIFIANATIRKDKIVNNKLGKTVARHFTIKA